VKPVSITRSSPDVLTFVWDDEHRSEYRLELLRDLCPCAGCKGETVLFQSYVPPPADKNVPGRYVLKSVTPIGSYAVQFSWGDGHETGIYTWEYLETLSSNPPVSD
jgi:DUF971 family protein